MTQTEKNQLARTIVEHNQYMSVASSWKANGAWISPVCYAPDKNYNLYFVSLPGSRHAQNTNRNPRVTVSIFDSHQPWGEGVGLQIEGKITRVNWPRMPFFMKLYFSRAWPYVSDKLATYLKGFKKILKNRTYRAYQFTPTCVWMNDPDSEVDRRIEVSLI